MAENTSGYPNPHLLVETGWLAEHLQDPNIRILDCDVRDAYRRAHIPGAVCPKEHYMKNPENNRLIMEPEQFAEEMAQMGIGDDTLVVAYDASGGVYAARFWWCLRYYGHDRCVVVNGGWNKWLKEGHPVTYQEPKPPRASFTPKVCDDLVCRVDYLKEAIGKPGTVIWDVRSVGEWNGANSRGNQRVGHVPGAAHLEWLNCVTRDDVQTVKPAAELRAASAASHTDTLLQELLVCRVSGAVVE
ncbi:MAG: sulfurtransferase [Chloroflexi bacterium]|nr:sulfurtransferase [Chloroflexota bacterium]